MREQRKEDAEYERERLIAEEPGLLAGLLEGLLAGLFEFGSV
jgi:hypothetical protein